MNVNPAVKETAKLIRQELKKQFPHVKFQVRTKTYVSLSSTIYIDWEDGETEMKVAEIVSRFNTGILDLNLDFYRTYSMKNYVAIGEKLAKEYGQPIPTFTKQLGLDNNNSLVYKTPSLCGVFWSTKDGKSTSAMFLIQQELKRLSF